MYPPVYGLHPHPSVGARWICPSRLNSKLQNSKLQRTFWSLKFAVGVLEFAAVDQSQSFKRKTKREAELVQQAVLDDIQFVVSVLAPDLIGARAVVERFDGEVARQLALPAHRPRLRVWSLEFEIWN